MKAMILLIVLLALPFSMRVQAENDLDAATSTRWDIYPDSSWTVEGWRVFENAEDSIGYLSIPDTSRLETFTRFVVYYIDTVGWRLTFDNRVVTLLENEDTVPVVDSFWYRLFGEPLLEPVTKAVIIAHFRTDADTEKIRRWRVREK